MRETEMRRRGASGFTLIEVLVGIVLLGLIAVAVAAISLPGVLRISGDNQERQLDATTAQWVSLRFGRDVQGASGTEAAECGTEGTRLVTLGQSDGRPSVEYRYEDRPDGFALIRVVCGVGPEDLTTGLDVPDPPSVQCKISEGGVVGCAVDGSPRTINLALSRTDSFGFGLDGVRREIQEAGLVEFELPSFLGLGGKPLFVPGTAELEVNGNAFINAPDGSTDDEPLTLVDLRGDAYLEVTGEFGVQKPGICPECDTKANKEPLQFTQGLPDPLDYLPPPDTTDLDVVDKCVEQTFDGVDELFCPQGIYEVQFPPTGDAAGQLGFRLEQGGTYVLRGGMKLNSGKISGDEVFIYNEAGSIDLKASLPLSAPVSGPYAGILLFQARAAPEVGIEDNEEVITIIGNGAVEFLDGAIYAPKSERIVLGGGGAQLSVGRVIGVNMRIFGSGKVTVLGS